MTTDEWWAGEKVRNCGEHIRVLNFSWCVRCDEVCRPSSPCKRCLVGQWRSKNQTLSDRIIELYSELAQCEAELRRFELCVDPRSPFEVVSELCYGAGSDEPQLRTIWHRRELEKEDDEEEDGEE
jgi:hypothetical protein